MKRLTAIILSIILLFTITVSAVAVSTYAADIKAQQERMAAAHDMAEAARKLGYQENHSVIRLAQQEWWEAHDRAAEYKALQAIEEEKWETKREEYLEATYVWEYLHNYGYNDYVCAGIIGNIMVEVGGYTLAIQPYLSSNTYAGMCQWSLRYRPEAKGLNLEEQCVFLTDTIESEFATFAWIYQSGFSYEAFKNMTDYEDAALAFAKVYERCGSGSYYLRQQCAATAYDYFVN